MYFLKRSSSPLLSRQNQNYDQLCMINQNCKYRPHPPRVGVIVVECGHIGDVGKMFKIFFITTRHKANLLGYDEQRI